jgi:predicted kinase
MLSLRSFLKEESVELYEKLITFAGQAYPKFGNIVIMAGGAGSGKGFVKDKLVGLEGYTFDVDALKTLAAKTPAIVKKVKDEMGIDLKDLASNLKTRENVAKLHEIIGSYLGLDNARQKALYTSILTADPDRKPNIIFDVTLKDLQKLETLTRQVASLGYDKKSVHIVWVINDIEVAKAQNARRARTVPVEILINTHRGASQTMLDIVNMGDRLKKYMDGDIVFAFNKLGIDAELTKSDSGGAYVKTANYFYIKRSGKPVMDAETISKDLRAKIAQYVPKNAEWL